MEPLRLKRLHRGVTAVWYFTECSDSAEQLAGLKNPSNLAQFFGSDSIGVYFEMACGLWNAFRLYELPRDLSDKETAEAERMLQQLTDFLQSGSVLRYFEMSTIINYTGYYVQLLDNVLGALDASQSIDGASRLDSAFASYCDQRQVYLSHWAYILQQTTPWCPRPQYIRDRMKIAKPSTFDTNETANRMMQIAGLWADHSFHEGLPDYSEGDYLKQGREMNICPQCFKVVQSRKLDKHLVFACKSSSNNEKINQRRRRWSFGDRSGELR